MAFSWAHVQLSCPWTHMLNVPSQESIQLSNRTNWLHSQQLSHQHSFLSTSFFRHLLISSNPPFHSPLDSFLDSIQVCVHTTPTCTLVSPKFIRTALYILDKNQVSSPWSIYIIPSVANIASSQTVKKRLHSVYTTWLHIQRPPPKRETRKYKNEKKNLKYFGLTWKSWVSKKSSKTLKKEDDNDMSCILDGHSVSYDTILCEN